MAILIPKKIEPKLTYLVVPFDDRAHVKALGARWDMQRKLWYILDGHDATKFSRWNLPIDGSIGYGSTLRKEDRSKVSLYVDMVPRSAWYSNLRSELNPIEWEHLKRKTFQEANNCCEACDGIGPDHPVECHERWSYDEETQIQKLECTVAFCPDCHEATHYGLAGINGRSSQARAQLMKVNAMTPACVDDHIRQASADWRRRNAIKWTLDASWLFNHIPLSEKSKIKIQMHLEGIVDRSEEKFRMRQRGG